MGFAVLVLAVLAVVMAVSVPVLGSRWLAALAAVSLLISAATVVTDARIPVRGGSLATLSYLDVVMFPVGVLIWLTVGSAAVLLGRLVISRLVRSRGVPMSTAGRAW